MSVGWTVRYVVTEGAGELRYTCSYLALIYVCSILFHSLQAFLDPRTHALLVASTRVLLVNVLHTLVTRNSCR